MEIVGKISKGSKMDQIYIPKNRSGFAIGNYVIIKPIESRQMGQEEKQGLEKLYFYGVKELEPIKLEILQEVMGIIEKGVENYENIIVTGSFLEQGFNFNDIDVLIIRNGEVDEKLIGKKIKEKIGMDGHVLSLKNEELIKGLETDPLYELMLSKCVAKKRFIYKNRKIIDYKLLDLHLLKSKVLIDNFDILSGKQKYDLVRNMVAIYLRLHKKKVNHESVNSEIKKSLGVDSREIKENIIDKKIFVKKYSAMYEKLFADILRGIESGAKQK